MAKKLRKVTTPPRLLLFEFLVPWIVMGAVAMIALNAGLGDVETTLSALGCALATTVAIRFLEQRRRRTRMRSSEP